tara:strand:- start:227 stop:454 length:228 start_codon:yes stop_codon:yes gene_type:complete
MSPRIIIEIFDICPTVSRRNKRIKKKSAFSRRLPCALVICNISKLSPRPKFVFVSNLFLPVKKDKTKAIIVSAHA